MVFMASTSIDSKILAALHLLLENKKNGVKLENLAMQGMKSCIEDLVARGYAKKDEEYEGDNFGNDYTITSYYLTPEGLKYFDKVLRFATEQF